MAMNVTQIDRLVATVPAGLEGRQRRRLDGYAAAARRCDERITALRTRLEWAITAAGEDPSVADEVLDAMLEIEALERVQLRVDAGLRASVGALVEQTVPEPVGEGPV